MGRTTHSAGYTYTLTDGKATLTGYSGAGDAITIPDTLLGDTPVTAIGAGVFKNYTSLTSVLIPAGITSIDNTAFDGCTSVTSFTVDPANSIFSSVAGVLFNKSQSTLLHYPKGKPGIYDIPLHVTAIVDKAFKDCIALTKVTVPGSVITFGTAIFQGCTSLTHVTLPSRMETITSSMFYGCSSLTHITLPLYLKKIELNAFRKCSGLTSIKIPDRVTDIASYAFRQCNNLERVYFTNQPPITVNLAFQDTNATLYYLPLFSFAWGTSLAGRPAVLWNPTFAGTTLNAGQAALTITGTPDIPIALEATTNLASGEWIRLTTTELTNGSKTLYDPDAASYPNRFYRIVSP